MLSLADIMLGERQIRTYNERGELFPDPNLIFNIDHMYSFLEIELVQWETHKKKIDEALISSDVVQSTHTLFDDFNRRMYLKSLLSSCAYYVACVEAIEKLMQQMYRINNQNRLHLKKPKIKEHINQEIHSKALFIRNKSFIHQDSNQIANPMDKRVAMDWNVMLSGKIGSSPSCENYQFGQFGWWVEVNEERTESAIDIKVEGFSDFCSTVLGQLDIRKERAANYFGELSAAIERDKT